jgi:hypothetical protein
MKDHGPSPAPGKNASVCSKNRVRGMAQVGEHLPSKCKALHSNPSTIKKIKNERMK